MIKLFRAVIMLPFISAPAQRPNHSFILTAPNHPQANTRPVCALSALSISPYFGAVSFVSFSRVTTKSPADVRAESQLRNGTRVEI